MRRLGPKPSFMGVLFFIHNRAYLVLLALNMAYQPNDGKRLLQLSAFKREANAGGFRGQGGKWGAKQNPPIMRGESGGLLCTTPAIKTRPSPFTRESDPFGRA
jgi:hypothetical protein